MTTPCKTLYYALFDTNKMNNGEHYSPGIVSYKPNTYFIANTIDIFKQLKYDSTLVYIARVRPISKPVHCDTETGLHWVTDVYNDKLQTISKFLQSDNKESTIFTLISACGLVIQFIPAEKQTEELCIAAIHENPKSIWAIHPSNWTHSVCLTYLKLVSPLP